MTRHSEVATIKYRESECSFLGSALRLTLIFVLVQSDPTMPVPKIFDWSDDSSIATGSEYIIMDHLAASYSCLLRGLGVFHSKPSLSSLDNTFLKCDSFKGILILACLPGMRGQEHEIDVREFLLGRS